VGIQKVVKMAKICKLYILINLYKKYIGTNLELIPFFFVIFLLGSTLFYTNIPKPQSTIIYRCLPSFPLAILFYCCCFQRIIGVISL